MTETDIQHMAKCTANDEIQLATVESEIEELDVQRLVAHRNVKNLKWNIKRQKKILADQRDLAADTANGATPESWKKIVQTEDIDGIRLHCCWAVLNENAIQPWRYVPVRTLPQEHLEAIVAAGEAFDDPIVATVLLMELGYRQAHAIEIKTILQKAAARAGFGPSHTPPFPLEEERAVNQTAKKVERGPNPCGEIQLTEPEPAFIPGLPAETKECGSFFPPKNYCGELWGDDFDRVRD